MLNPSMYTLGSLLVVAWTTLVVSNDSQTRENGNLPNSNLLPPLKTFHLSLHDAPDVVAVDTPPPGTPEERIDQLPRPASEATWRKAVCKGTKMMAQMSYSDFDVGQLLPQPATTAQSPWKLSDIYAWGYEMYPGSEEYCDYTGKGFWGIDSFLQRMSLADKCGADATEWKALSVQHRQRSDIPPEDQTYTDPHGTVRRVANAEFHMSVLTGVGIMAQNRVGPVEAMRHLHPDFTLSELPALMRSSDIMWAMWEHAVPAFQRRELQIFASLTITNPATLALISRAFGDVGEDIGEKATVFKMDTEQGKVLLSSPNGAGFAHFLIQRKGQLGLKRIFSVAVFWSSTSWKSPCMVFVVDDLDKPMPRPEDDAAPVAGPADPNGTEMTDAPAAPPGHVPAENKHGVRRLAKRNFVRMHTFTLNTRGNVILSSSIE